MLFLKKRVECVCVKGEGGERSISHTQKGIQGGNVRGDDVSEWAWVMEKAFREKRRKKKADDD